jgi:hypothetical protein
MKKYLLYILVPLIFVLILTVFVACSYERGPMLIPTSTQLPTGPAAKAAATPQPAGNDSQKVYPATPETVVQAYLLALQADPALALRYLSTPLKSQLPVGGPSDLLAVTGVITGTAIQSGAASLDPPAAQVDVGLMVEEKTPLPEGTQVVKQAQVKVEEFTRRFKLIKENDRWVINSIESVK